MELHGALADRKARGDLPVGEPRRHQPEHLALARREGVRALRGAHLPEQLRGDHRRDEGAAGAHGADGGEDLGARRAFQQVPLGAGLEGAEDPLVGIERRQHHHLHGRIGGAQAADGLDAVERGHLQIHQHDVRPQPGRLGHGLGAGAGLADHLEIRLRSQHGREPVADHRLVVGQEDADGLSHEISWGCRR